jgi:hypothetical protein
MGSGEDIASAQIESILLKGRVHNVKIGKREFGAPRILTGDVWAMLPADDGKSNLTVQSETYALDPGESARSNAAGESFDSAVDRLTKRFEKRGLRALKD